MVRGLFRRPYDDRVSGPGRRTAAAVAVVGLLLTGAGCSGDDDEGVEVGTVGRATVVERVEAPASVVARASATVTAPATGTVARIQVRDGQAVSKGQVLLVVDSPAAERALAQATAAAAGVPDVDLPGLDLSAQATRAEQAAREAFAAARDAARQIPDRALRQAALARVEQAEAQYEAAAAQARSVVHQVNQGVASVGEALSALTQAQEVQLQVAVASAQATVDALTVRAPIGGTVVLGASTGDSATDVSGLVESLPESLAGQAGALLSGTTPGGSTSGVLERGSPVSAGDPLLTITDVSTLSLVAQVDETDVLLVQKAVRADVEFDAVPGASYGAVVRNVDLAPTTSARGGVSYVVRLALHGGTTATGDPAPQPRPGMSAVASLRVSTARDAVAVPVTSVFRDGEHDAVWLVVDGEAAKTQVVLGAQGDDFVQVLDGIVEGDEVVVSGADRVSEGQRVQ